ncbi:hypothetical protein FB451DRAFT_1442845 [Mycena latifolia]|nr:hypothetical protein FB451DRAFT_1442845 [Mycena latifolia]
MQSIQMQSNPWGGKKIKKILTWADSDSICALKCYPLQLSWTRSKNFETRPQQSVKRLMQSHSSLWLLEIICLKTPSTSAADVSTGRPNLSPETLCWPEIIEEREYHLNQALKPSAAGFEPPLTAEGSWEFDPASNLPRSSASFFPTITLKLEDLTLGIRLASFPPIMVLQLHPETSSKGLGHWVEWRSRKEKYIGKGRRRRSPRADAGGGHTRTPEAPRESSYAAPLARASLHPSCRCSFSSSPSPIFFLPARSLVANTNSFLRADPTLSHTLRALSPRSRPSRALRTARLPRPECLWRGCLGVRLRRVAARFYARAALRVAVAFLVFGFRDSVRARSVGGGGTRPAGSSRPGRGDDLRPRQDAYNIAPAPGRGSAVSMLGGLENRGSAMCRRRPVAWLCGLRCRPGRIVLAETATAAVSILEDAEVLILGCGTGRRQGRGDDCESPSRAVRASRGGLTAERARLERQGSAGVGAVGPTARLLTLTSAGVQLWDACARRRRGAPSADSPSATVTLTSMQAEADEKADGEEELGMYGPIVGAAVLPIAPREGRGEGGARGARDRGLFLFSCFVSSRFSSMPGWRAWGGVGRSEARVRVPFGGEGAGRRGFHDALVLELELAVVMERDRGDEPRVQVLIELYAPGEYDWGVCVDAGDDLCDERPVSVMWTWWISRRCSLLIVSLRREDACAPAMTPDQPFSAMHAFAVNPYGGRADVRSHLGVQVRDAEGVAGGEDAPKEVHALVRLRLPAPLAVALVPPRREHARALVALARCAGVPPRVLSLRRATVAHGAGLPNTGLAVGLGAAGRGEPELRVA